MSSRPLIAKYPLDKSGTSVTNKVIGEIRDINSNLERAFVPYGGPFYTNSMKITDVATGKPLIPIDDYILCQPFQQAALRTGLDVQCVVWLKTKAPTQVSIEYQVVGGEYSWNIQALVQMIAEITLDDRPISWGAIIGKPTAYPPAPHIHDIGDSYGWEYVVFQLEGIRNAILVGDEASHDEIRKQIQAIRDDINLELDALDGRISAHLSDFTNPHKVTKLQVGLGSVEDFPIASAAEALAGTAANRYMTPQRTATLIARMLGDALDAHIQDKNNPHNTTKAQVGLGNVANYAVASTAEAQAGVVNDKYMTPALTKASIMTLVGDGLNTHIANISNPHKVTAAQVGLGLVENLAVASLVEAQAGTASNKYMTPLRVKDAIMALVGNAFNTHAAATNNPHATTKAQVGLGSVENFPLASTAEAQAAASTVRYMTPALTRSTVMALIGDSFNAHAGNTNNPHGVTKAQIGLSAIPNAITRGRGVNSDAQLLTAGSMYDHVNSADHDARYTPKDTASVNGSIHVSAGRGYIAIDGAWRQVFPAQWQ